MILKICVFTCVRIQQKHWMPLLRVVLLVVTCQVFHSHCSSVIQAMLNVKTKGLQILPISTKSQKHFSRVESLFNQLEKLDN